MGANKGRGLQVIDSYSSGHPVSYFHGKLEFRKLAEGALTSVRVDWGR